MKHMIGKVQVLLPLQVADGNSSGRGRSGVRHRRELSGHVAVRHWTHLSRISVSAYAVHSRGRRCCGRRRSNLILIWTCGRLINISHHSIANAAAAVVVVAIVDAYWIGNDVGIGRGRGGGGGGGGGRRIGGGHWLMNLFLLFAILCSSILKPDLDFRIDKKRFLLWIGGSL